MGYTRSRKKEKEAQGLRIDKSSIFFYSLERGGSHFALFLIFLINYCFDFGKFSISFTFL